MPQQLCSFEYDFRTLLIADIAALCSKRTKIMGVCSRI